MVWRLLDKRQLTIESGDIDPLNWIQSKADGMLLKKFDFLEEADQEEDV